MNATRKWHEKPLRILDFIPPDPDRYETLDVREQYRIRADLGFNAEHVEVHDVSLGESGITFYPSEAAVETRKNVLQEIVDVYDPEVLKPLVYFNVHWLAPSLAERRPDWLQLGADGSVLPSAYGAGGYSCVNSPFRDYALSTVRTLARYPIGGIFLDGPIFREDGCYCQACREKFEREYGYAPPAASKPGTQEDVDWFAFRRSSIAGFMEVASEALKAIRPEAIIYMNSPQLAPNRLCSRDNRLTVPHQDMLLAEGGFLGGDLRTVPVWKPAATALLLETQAGGKPVCVAIAGRHSPWSRYLLTPAETWLAYAMAAAHGASIWYGVYNDNNRDNRMQTVRDINLFLKRHERWYEGTSSMARIALLWSYATANYYQTTADETDFTDAKRSVADRRKNDSRKAFNGWFDVLSRSRIPFDVIDDTALCDGTLQRYDALVLPGASCMSDAEAEAIRRYVRAGGKIVATFDTGWYDEFGRPRAAPALADVTGIEAAEASVRVCRFDHIPVLSGEELFAGVDQSFVPAPELAVQCKAGAGAQAIGYYREPQISRYCELPPQTEHPYAVRNRYGQGAVCYFTGNVDTMYANYALPEYRKMLSGAVAAFSEPEVRVQFETEVESVQLSLRRKGASIVLHLVNYTGSMTRPIDRIVALGNVRITLKIADGGMRDAAALRAGEQLTAVRKDGEVTFTLPALQEYEVIVAAPAGGDHIVPVP